MKDIIGVNARYMGNNKNWVLYDNISKIQSEPISEDQLQMSILRMNEKDWDRFYVISKGWEKWQPLRLFLKSGQAQFLKNLNENVSPTDSDIKKSIQATMSPQTQSPLGSEKTITKSSTAVRINGEFTRSQIQPGEADFSIDDLKLNPEASKLEKSHLASNQDYRNRAKRHELKIDVVLITPKGKTFRSYSKNISLTGTLLADSVPMEFLEGYFEVVIVNKYSNDANSRVLLKGSVVSGDGRNRIHFENVAENTTRKLKDLLTQYLAAKDKALKQAG